MFPSMHILRKSTYRNSPGYKEHQLANHVTANNTTIFDVIAIILFQQTEVTSMIQYVVAIFSSECFLHHKEDLKWTSML